MKGKIQVNEYIKIIREYSKNNYTKIKREAEGKLKYSFIVPGKAYPKELWDYG